MNRLLNYKFFIGLCLFNILKDFIGLPQILGSIISLFIVLLSFINLIKLHCFYSKFINNYIKALDLLLLILTIYGFIFMYKDNIIYDQNGPIAMYSFLLMHWLSLLPIYSFYLYTLKEEINEKNINKIFYFFLIVTVLNFYFNMQARMLFSMKDDVVNGASYLFLPLFSLLYLLKIGNTNKILLYTLMLVFIVVSLKRGAILIAFLLYIIYINNIIIKIPWKMKLLIFSFMIPVFVAAIHYIYQFYYSNPLFQLKLEQTLEGNSSGRDVIYSHFLSFFLNQSNEINLLFGNGAYSTLEIFNIMAHNDWLEFAINMGIIGVVVYLIYWCSSFKALLKIKKLNIKSAFGGIVLIYFLKSLFSMSVICIEYSGAFCIGYCLAVNYLFKNINSKIISQ